MPSERATQTHHPETQQEPRLLEPGRKESQQFQKVVPDIFGLEASELASLGAKRFHGKPPLIGLGAPRRSGGGRVQTFAIIRFLFGRAKIMAKWAAPGLVCTAERHLRLQDNFSFAEVSEAKIADLVRAVARDARDGCDAVAI